MLRALALMAALAASGWAQLPRGFYPWWDQPIVKNLHLSDAQSREIRTIVREYRARLIEQRASLEKAESELQFLFDDDNIDTKRANQAIEDLANARLNLTRTFSQLALRLRVVLTPDQWRDLQKRREQIQEQRREFRQQQKK
mgnify:CR=1 FL=1